MLKTIAFIKGHKWTNMMIKRVYFGNWLRDYSQAMDVGSLKGVQAGTVRILVWVLSFLVFLLYLSTHFTDFLTSIVVFRIRHRGI